MQYPGGYGSYGYSQPYMGNNVSYGAGSGANNVSYGGGYGAAAPIYGSVGSSYTAGAGGYDNASFTSAPSYASIGPNSSYTSPPVSPPINQTGSLEPVDRSSLDGIEVGTYVITKHGKPAVDQDGWTEVDQGVGTSGPDRGRPLTVTTRVGKSNSTGEKAHDYSEEIINASRTEGTVPQLLANRVDELTRMVDVIENGLQALEARGVVTDECDRDPIRAQLDRLLPSAVEQDDGSNRDTSVGAPGEYLDLRELLDDLARRIRTGTSDYFEPLFQLVVDRGEAAYVVLRDTRNDEIEQELCGIIRIIIDEFDKYMSLSVPDGSKVHSDSETANADCLALEEQRVRVDWSQKMMDSETNLYARVAEILRASGVLIDEADEAVDTLNGIAREGIDDGMHALVKAAEDEERRLKNQQDEQDKLAAEELAQYNRLRDGLVAAAAKSETIQDEHAAAVAKAAGEVRAALQALKKAQTDLWAEEKKMHLFNVATELLDAKHQANLALADGETDNTEARLLDAAAAMAAGKIAHDMVEEISVGLDGFEGEHREALVSLLFVLLTDRIKLITREYFKTALAYFAANSRVEIKEQEKKAVLVKKERRNVAQDIAGVEECNVAVAKIENEIADELANIEVLKTELKNRSSERSALHDRLVEVSGTSTVRRDVTKDLEVEFKETVSELRKIEEEKHRSLFLDDLLDAAFL